MTVHSRGRGWTQPCGRSTCGGEPSRHSTQAGAGSAGRMARGIGLANGVGRRVGLVEADDPRALAAELCAGGAGEGLERLKAEVAFLAVGLDPPRAGDGTLTRCYAGSSCLFLTKSLLWLYHFDRSDKFLFDFHHASQP